MPKTVPLNGVQALVEDRRGKPIVHLDARQKARLEKVDLKSLPPTVLNWKAELLDGTLIWGRPMALVKWLALLPHVPLPEPRGDGSPKADVPRDIPLGALLELDRNLHTLARLLPRLLSPHVISKERQGGWLALVSNGEGGFWVELVSDWMDALTTTLESLRDLRTALPDEDALASQIDSELTTLEQRSFDTHDALENAKRLVPSPRRP